MRLELAGRMVAGRGKVGGAGGDGDTCRKRKSAAQRAAARVRQRPGRLDAAWAKRRLCLHDDCAHNGEGWPATRWMGGRAARRDGAATRRMCGTAIEQRGVEALGKRGKGVEDGELTEENGSDGVTPAGVHDRVAV